MDIDPSSSLNILDRYDEAEVIWFINKLRKDIRRKEIINDLNTVNNRVVAGQVGTKKGNSAYNRWRRELIEELESLDKEPTVFEKLRTDPKKGTVFGKLKTWNRS